MLPGALRLAAWSWLALLLVVLGAGVTSEVRAEVRAFADPAVVYEGDAIQLTIEADGLSPPGRPDLAPLQDDFELGGTSRSQETQIVNGRRADRTSWRVALVPKRVGALRIPAIQVGSERTEPLLVQVEPIPEGGLGRPGDQVWIEVEVEGGQDGLVVQQQVPLVVRAYSAKPLVDYRIEVPPIDGAVLMQIGRDRGNMVTRAGQQYRLIERRFTLNPERSGSLRIPPVAFDAELKRETGTRPSAAQGLPSLFDDPMFDRMLGGIGSGFSMFERGEPARAQSEAITLEVAPSPAGFSGQHWLPATGLEVQDSWNPDQGGQRPLLSVGEPATRTLTLQAVGLAGNQIPEIDIPVPDGFRVYPEKTESETRSDGETVIGVSRQQLTLIPTRGGDVTLPRIEVPWWDTEADVERVAEVPAIQLGVTGPAEPPELHQLDAAVAETRTGLSSADRLVGGAAPAASAKGSPSAESGVFGGIVVGLLLVAGLLAGAYGLWRWRHPGARRHSSRSLVGGVGLAGVAAGAGASEAEAVRLASDRSELVRAAKSALQQACERNDAPAAARALIEWAGALRPQGAALGLGAIAERVVGVQRSEIQALERSLYAAVGEQGGWTGDALWHAVKAGLNGDFDDRGAKTEAVVEGLPPLYPRRA